MRGLHRLEGPCLPMLTETPHAMTTAPSSFALSSSINVSIRDLAEKGPWRFLIGLRYTSSSKSRTVTWTLDPRPAPGQNLRARDFDHSDQEKCAPSISQTWWPPPQPWWPVPGRLDQLPELAPLGGPVPFTGSSVFLGILHHILSNICRTTLWYRLPSRAQPPAG